MELAPGLRFSAFGAKVLGMSGLGPFRLCALGVLGFRQRTDTPSPTATTPTPTTTSTSATTATRGRGT